MTAPLYAAAPNQSPRAIFDCNVFIQAAVRSLGPARACLDLVEPGRIRLVTSYDILSELRAVLLRRSLREKFPSLTHRRVKAYISRIAIFSEIYDRVPKAVTYPRDPKDELYLNLLVESKADYLVSRDKDLLDLSSSDDPTAKSLRSFSPYARITDPVEFLQIIAYPQS